MIRVDFSRTADGTIKGFSCRGHAGSDIRGKDIVCAAVSMTVINTLNSIETLLPSDGEKMFVRSDEEEGVIECEFRETPSKEAELLLNSMYLGLKTIEKDHNGEFLSIKG